MHCLLVLSLFLAIQAAAQVLDGAMQLEESLLYAKAERERENEPQQPPAKRQRRSTGGGGTTPAGGRHAVMPTVGTDEGTWAALAEVYQAAGEQHLMHVTYTTHIARSGSWLHVCTWSASAYGLYSCILHLS